MAPSYSPDICYPITEISLVLSWKCDGNCWIHKHDTLNISDKMDFKTAGSLLDLRGKEDVFLEYKLPSKSLPKTIFCHDYKGGYLEDRFCNGSPNIDTYRFFNWACIDIFIYFSHKLVTIPPQGWTNAAHVHGVPILGTLITEWTEGEAIWKEILVDLDKINLFSRKLAEICAHYKFDGYLLNIENKIPKNLIPRLINFVALLKSNLDLFCEKRTWLIWYDSVTTEGILDWQNKLCPLNKPFFNACDGIFLNYVWSPAGLTESIEIASNRKFDVFVGVDVWGRNCYQDGGFNVDKAMSFLRTLSMSVAIFGPAWTFETLPPKNFLLRESTFWKQISPYMYIHGPASLPFTTNFCQGILFDNEKGNPLFNLGLQQYQPTGQVCFTQDSCISLYLNDGLVDKGACLKISAASPPLIKTFHRMFVCDFACDQEKPSSLLVTLALKNLVSDPATKFLIFFLLEDRSSIKGNQCVSMKTRPKGYRTSTRAGDLTVAASLIDFTVEKQTDQPKIMVCHGDNNEIAAHSLWFQVKFVLELSPGSSLTEVLLLPPSSGSVLWGLIHIEKLQHL